MQTLSTSSSRCVCQTWYLSQAESKTTCNQKVAHLPSQTHMKRFWTIFCSHLASVNHSISRPALSLSLLSASRISASCILSISSANASSPLYLNNLAFLLKQEIVPSRSSTWVYAANEFSQDSGNLEIRLRCKYLLSLSQDRPGQHSMTARVPWNPWRGL